MSMFKSTQAHRQPQSYNRHGIKSQTTLPQNHHYQAHQEIQTHNLSIDQCAQKDEKKTSAKTLSLCCKTNCQVKQALSHFSIQKEG